MKQETDFLPQLAAALGPHSDLEFGRAATIAVLKQNAHPQESVEFFRTWAANHEPRLPHDRWFQRVLTAFLNALPADLRIGTVIEGLERATVPATPAETQESRARRFLVPGLRHRLLVAARRARLRERALGARF